jgi:hypothetical protein
MFNLVRLGRPAAVALAGACIASGADAATHTINWMNFSPVAMGGSIPNNSTYFLAGVGNVTVSYAFAGAYGSGRGNSGGLLNNGSVSSGGDTYQWSNWEGFDAVRFEPAPPPLSPWSITFTFTNTVAAGSIYLGVAGLGSTTDFGPPIGTVATVNQNGTYLGQYGGNWWGSNQYLSGSGWFSLENSVTGPGGQDPAWNTRLAVVRIDDAISSLTVDFWQLSGDGVILNIGAVPGPGGAALLGLAFIGGRRRRGA